MKISEWLDEQVDSHSILLHEKLAESLKHKTGEEPCWPIHTAHAAKRMIDARGLGGEVTAKPEELLCYGYEVAESLARKHTDYTSGHIQGRGSRFNLAVTFLQKAGM